MIAKTHYLIGHLDRTAWVLNEELMEDIGKLFYVNDKKYSCNTDIEKAIYNPWTAISTSYI